MSDYLRSPGRRAFTFLEIVIALVIMAVALIPIFGVIQKGTEETDVTSSQAYALNKATEILNALLDNVPFETLRAGTPAFMRVDDLGAITEYQKYVGNWEVKTMELLFPGSVKESKGWPCKGIVNDPRGISYLVTLRVEDVCSPTPPPGEKPERKKIGSSYPSTPPSDFGEHPRKDLTFSFLANPAKLSEPSWIQAYNKFTPTAQPPRWETEITLDKKGVAQPTDYNIYADPDFRDPWATRYVQRMGSEKVNYTNDDKYAYCAMKRLLVELQWNLNKRYFNRPEPADPKSVQRIHLMTVKGDIVR